MITTLIVTRNPNNAINYIENIRSKKSIDLIDVTKNELEGQSRGIEEIRLIQKQIYLKPIKSKEKILVINNFHKTTLEAQNAMLKLLEEPPNDTIIILISNSDSLLETVLSRCKVIYLDKNESKKEGDINNYTSLLVNLIEGSVGEKLKMAQDLSIDKEKSLEFLNNMIQLCRKNMLNSLSFKYVPVIQELQQSYRLASTTNINLRFLLEKTFILLKL